MKAKICLLFVLAMSIAMPAQADLIGTITHDYYTTVSDSTIFLDAFDLSGFEYESIDSFELTLSFSETGDMHSLFGLVSYYESWAIAAGNLTGGILSSLTNHTESTTQTFLIDAFDSDFLSAATSYFSEAISGLSADTFYLAIFDLDFLNANEFKLDSATLKLNGELKSSSVPVPASLWLLFGGVLSLIGCRRKFTA